MMSKVNFLSFSISSLILALCLGVFSFGAEGLRPGSKLDSGFERGLPSLKTISQCTEVPLQSELPMYAVPKFWDWENLVQSPRIRQLKGKVQLEFWGKETRPNLAYHLKLLGETLYPGIPESEFRQEKWERIVYIRLCDEGPYEGGFGVVSEEALRLAKLPPALKRGHMPPSVKGPIPVYRPISP